MAYNTGNAVPSSDPRDRSDNTVNMDKAVNDLVSLTWTDRKGVVRDTYAGIVAKAAKVLATGQIYSTTAAGIASGVQWFSIVAPSADETFILYENVAGVATERKRFPSAASINEMYGLISLIIGTGTTAYSFGDEQGFTLLKFLIDGSIDMLRASIENSEGGGLDLVGEDDFIYTRFGSKTSNINGLTVEAFPDGDGLYFMDANDFIIGKISEHGAFFGKQAPAAPVVLPPVVAQLNQQKRTQIMQVVDYGQSLSRGSQSLPAISTSQPYGNLMIKSGVKSRHGDSGYDASEFIPLVEDVVGVEGETPVSGICNGVTRRAVEGGELATDWVFAGMAAGVGGRSVEVLSPNLPGLTGPYEQMITSIGDCKSLADAGGKTYSVWGYFWAQGEAQHGAEYTKSPYEYAQKQMNIFDTMTVQIMAITGQEFRPYLFTYQVNAHRRYGYPLMPIALSQWRLSRERPDVVVSAPVYIFATAGDNLHLTNEGSWLMGEYTARAMHYTMVNRGEKWRPLEPISVKWVGAQIDVEFHVPVGGLVLDTALATAAPNHGFDLWVDAETREDIIAAVEVVGQKTIRLTLDRPASADAVLSYARGRVGYVSGPVVGSRGNLRDTHGDYDKVVSPLGNTFDMHNACVAFEYSRKTGF